MGSSSTLGLLAVGKKIGVMDERLLWATGGLVATLLTGALVLALVDRWRKRQFSPEDRQTEVDPLTPYRVLYQRGELSKAEYERIRQKLAGHYMNLANKPSSDGDAGSEKPPSPPPPPDA